MTDDTNDVQRSYDAVADPYAERFFDELTHKPLDRALLGMLAEELAGRGVVADVGCGPGHVARWLHARGADVLGVDLSPKMVTVAQARSPALRFEQGSFLRLPAQDEAWAGVVAFYSIIHVQPADLPAAMAELRRVLSPGGPLLLAFHIGSKAVHLDTWMEQPVSLNFQFYELDALATRLQEARFKVEMQLERAPYQPFEVDTRRGYILARAS